MPSALRFRVACALVLLFASGSGASAQQREGPASSTELTNLRLSTAYSWGRARDAFLRSDPDTAMLHAEARPGGMNAVEARILLLLLHDSVRYHALSAAWAELLAGQQARGSLRHVDPDRLHPDLDVSAFEDDDAAVFLAERLLKDNDGLIARTYFRSGPDDDVPAFRAVALAAQLLARHPGNVTAELALLRALRENYDSAGPWIEQSLVAHASPRMLKRLESILARSRTDPGRISSEERIRSLEAFVERVRNRTCPLSCQPSQDVGERAQE